MLIRLKRYTIEEQRNVAGKVLSARYGYVIVIWKWRWNRLRIRKYYLRLLNDWYNDYKADKPVGVELTRSRSEATNFSEDDNLDYKQKSLAEEIIKKIKSEPDKFVLK